MKKKKNWVSKIKYFKIYFKKLPFDFYFKNIRIIQYFILSIDKIKTLSIQISDRWNIFNRINRYIRIICMKYTLPSLQRLVTE